MAKPRYSDEFRASAVAMLKAAGWPDRKGALMGTAKRLGVSHQTLGRWGRQESNPAPSDLVLRKEMTIAELLDHEIRAAMAEMEHARPDAGYRDLQVGVGIMIDKKQLLTGEATERTEHTTTTQQLDSKLDSLAATNGAGPDPARASANGTGP